MIAVFLWFLNKALRMVISIIIPFCGPAGTLVPTKHFRILRVGTGVSARPQYLLLLLVFAFQVTNLHADVLPDDHGNSAIDATALAGASNTVTGQIEFDTDIDYFSFPFYPARSYVIQIITGTVWDVELSITPPSWPNAYMETNTARQSPAAINWTNNGALGTWSLSVEGMFRYTTGSYHLAVWESPFNQDADGDGMTDSWETNQLGSVTNKPGDDYDHDGQSNLQEFLSQTQGNNANSAVQVDWVNAASGDDYAGWYQAAFSTYQIYAATNIYGPWEYLEDSVADETGGSILWTNNAGGSSIRFYRVDFVY